MTYIIRFSLVAIALGWLCAVVVGGVRVGLERSSFEREELIGEALQEPVLVDRLRDEATARAMAAAPEVTQLVAPLLDDALAQFVASQPVVHRLVAAEVDQRLGLGHEAVSITTADLPGEVQTWLSRIGVEVAIELVPASEPAGGPVELLDNVLLLLAALTIAVHMAVARWVSRSAAAFAGCIGAGAGLLVLTAGQASSSLVSDPLQRAVLASAIPQEILASSGTVLLLIAGRAMLAHFGKWPYGSFAPAHDSSGGFDFDFGDE